MLPTPTLPAKRGYARLLLVMLLVLTCLGMARLQLWRAETRGERFEREQAARSATPINLSASQRVHENLLDKAAIARGRWLPGQTLFLDNKIHHGRAGYHVLTPLRLSGSNAVVLVNRGWMPGPRLRSDVPSVATPTGEIEVAGLTHSFEIRTFELKDTLPQGSIWQHVREADYLRTSGLDALPVILLQTGADSDGLVRDWASPENPAYKHYGYATMWTVFAFMAGAYGFFAWRKK